MTRPLKALHLYNVFGLGTERAWLDYPLRLAERGHSITFAAEQIAAEAPRIPYPLITTRRIMAQPVERVEDVAAEMDHIAEAPACASLRQLLAEGLDLVHGHFGPRLLQAAPFHRAGVPVVISLYGYDVSRLVGDAAWPARYRWAAEHGVTFVVLGESMRQRLSTFGVPADRIRIIRLGIDLDRWSYRPAPAPGVPRWIFIGRLTAKKAPLVLIEAFASLRRRHPGARLDIIGAGPLEPALRQRLAQKGLAEQVQLHGSIPREDLAAMMAGATALVLPSVTAPDGDSEGTPVVLMEAQAMGLPCITTRHAGNPEVIPPAGQRFVVPEHDPAALAEAMTAMIRLSPAERQTLQQAGRQWIEQHFDFEKTVEAYDRLYRELTTAAAESTAAHSGGA